MVKAGCNLLEAEKEARELGFEIEIVGKSGEEQFRHPLLGRSIRVNSRRKDAPRNLTNAIARVRKLQHGEELEGDLETLELDSESDLTTERQSQSQGQGQEREAIDMTGFSFHDALRTVSGQLQAGMKSIADDAIQLQTELFQGSIAELRQELTSLGQGQTHLKQKLQSLEQDLDTQNQELAGLLGQARQELLGQLQARLAEIETLQSEDRQSLKTAIDRVATNYQALTNQEAERDRRYASANQRLQHIEEGIGEIQKTSLCLQGEIESTLDAIQKEFQSLSQRIENSFQALTSRTNKITESLQEQSKSLENLQTQVQTLEVDQQALDQRVQHLEQSRLKAQLERFWNSLRHHFTFSGRKSRQIAS